MAILRLLLIILLASLLILPAGADQAPDGSAIQNATGPQLVEIGVYLMDLNSFNVADGTFIANFYLTLRSNSSVSIDDLEIVNGKASSIDTLLDKPHEKTYRLFALMTTYPDLRLYPFDHHQLPIMFEPKMRDINGMTLAIYQKETGLEPDFDLPGWNITESDSSVTSKSYESNETPYSRAVFRYAIKRDTTSTILKFFLPLLLILVISLSSLLMKGPYRLTLNASMLIIAVFIHWRISDAIPLVAYATFLDIFMLITYAIIAIVLISGILIIWYTETEKSEDAALIHCWSIRIIPLLSITLYLLLFGLLIPSP